MALCHINFFGASIGQMSSMNVIVPEGVKGPYATFYLLHGLSDDHTAWQRRTSIERYVEGLPLVVVMPSTARGWYSNVEVWPVLRYEDHIMKDVIGFVESTFPVKRERKARAIGGLSMGGFGAVKLGLKHHDMFCSVNSHSGALERLDRRAADKKSPLDDAFMREVFGVLGQSLQNTDNDLDFLAEKCPKNRRPELLIDCGREDFLLAANRGYHKFLQSIKYTHTYREFPGNHNWQFWDTHVQEALAFHRKNLGI
jgi:S-formylglutathione hydrolase FrmB